MKYLLFILQFNLIFSKNICEKLYEHPGSIKSNEIYSKGLLKTISKYTILGRLVLNQNGNNLPDYVFDITRAPIEEGKYFFFVKYDGYKYKLVCEPDIDDEKGYLISFDSHHYKLKVKVDILEHFILVLPLDGQKESIFKQDIDFDKFFK